MKFTAENLIEKEIEVNGVKTTAIQHLIDHDQLDYGKDYKATFKVKYVDITKLTKLVLVLGFNNAKEMQINMVNVKKNEYWIVEELIKLGFELEL